ncbi:hypothetical protein CRUP_020097, partial [Coryphaenoides rupestris]
MSSRRKSTTPCMVLPSNMVEQVEEDEEEKEGRMKVRGEAVVQGGEEEEASVRKKSGEGEVVEGGAAAAAAGVEEVRESVVVIAPTPPEPDDPAFPPTEGRREPLVSLKPGPAERSLEAVLCGDGESAMLSDPQPCHAAPGAGVEARAPPREEAREVEEVEVEEVVEEEQSALGAISLSKTPIMRMKSKAEPKRIAVSLKSREEALTATADVFGTGLGGGGGGGGEGEEGGVGEQEQPIEAPLGPMTPVEMLLQDSMRYGGGSLLINMPGGEQQQHRKKSSAHSSSALPAGLAQQQRQQQRRWRLLLLPWSSPSSWCRSAVSRPTARPWTANPLLGNTYKKFPYPSMAEIASLAAQTQFTEEQIKVWFSAQRLKHGVSWTPEEVEEARRKQFNGTVHTVPQTITVIPAHHLSAAANGLQSILQTCQI